MNETGMSSRNISAVSRRTVIKGAAWSVPVIAAAVAAPAASASGPDGPFTLVWTPSASSAPDPQGTLVVNAPQQLQDGQYIRLSVGNDTSPPFTLHAVSTDPAWTAFFPDDIPFQQYLGYPTAGSVYTFTISFGNTFGATSGSIHANLVDINENVIASASPFVITEA